MSLSVQGGPHVTITHDALDLSVQRPSLTYQTWDPSQAHPSPIPQTPLQTSHMGPNPKLATSGGHHWRPVQTCSFEDQPPLVLKSGGQSNRCQAGGMHPAGMPYYRPQRSCEGYVFTPVCLSTRGGLPQCMLGYHIPQQTATVADGTHPTGVHSSCL